MNVLRKPQMRGSTATPSMAASVQSLVYFTSASTSRSDYERRPLILYLTASLCAAWSS